MKCPCCGSSTDQDLIVYGNEIYFSDGTKITIELGAAKILAKLLVRPLQMTPGDLEKLTIPVYVSRLRKIFFDLGLPYAIRRNRGTTYELVRLNVQNNNPSQHTQNVHSRSGVYDFRRRSRRGRRPSSSV